MIESNRIPYQEIDFLLPIHRFKIGFSYLSQRGLPFIREFVLRLIHLAPMRSQNIADFLGLSELEVDEALRDLLDKNEIEYLNDGSIGLTQTAKAYFHKAGDSPQVATIQQTECTFSFDLAGFNCLGDKRTNESWNAGIQLSIPSEKVGLSDRYANENFQKQFYKLLDRGFMPHIVDPEKKSQPSIYKMDSVTRISTEPKRLTQIFSVDVQGNVLERDGFEEFYNEEPVVEAITEAISAKSAQSNLKQIISAMEHLGDDLCSKYVFENRVDIQGMVIEVAKSMSLDKPKQMFLGPVYSAGNWDRISRVLFSIFEAQAKLHQESIPDFVWLAPSDPFWGYSQRLIDAKGELFGRARTTGKNPRPIFSPKLYLPLSAIDDRSSVHQWKRQLDSSENVYGYIEGLLGGSVELIVLPDRFALISYHIMNPEVSPVPMPLGFYTTDVKEVNKIESLLSGYLQSPQGFDHSIDLGPLSKL